MSNAQSFVAIGVSLFLGGVAGLWAGRSAGFAPGERIGSSAAAGKVGPATGLEREREGLRNISADTGLEGLSFQKQKEVLLRLRDKLGGMVPAHLQLALARMVRGFTADQTAELLEVLPSGLEVDFVMPSAALAYANALPEGPLRNRALATLARWPGLKIEQYPAILAAVGELDAVTALEWGRNLAGVAEKLPPGLARDTAFAKATEREVKSDPAAAAARLESMAGSPDYAAAVLGFVRGSASKDPAAAAEWALSIGTESDRQRQVALETVAAAWFKANPGEARAWVEQAPLSGPEYFQLTGRPRSK